MHLSRVELFGFKSFADRTTFDLDRGITAVLGPNGCGKSNVVDAVKWVLGESSPKNLRGAAMSDVIFAGAEGRKPLGMAEVTLYFNNEDGRLPIEYNEVSVTRRLFRSGESEYLINKQPCRKRDIRDLFLDTGIGTSAYSFIEQGRVESLLQAKPHERRLVFEEAAGISKYKQRRKETLARLGRTNQYLFRVNDIVEEVEKNVRRVGRQAANARRYQRLKIELDALKTVHAVRAYRTHAARLETLRGELAEIRSLRDAEDRAQGVLGTELAALTAREMELAGQVDAQDAGVREVQDVLTRIQVELSACEERRKSISQESENAAARAVAIRERLTTLEGEETQARAALEEAKKAVDGLQDSVGGQDARRTALQETLRETEQEIDTLRKEMLSIAQERNRFDSEQARMESEARSLREQEARLTGTVRGLETEAEGVEAALAEVRAAREVLAAEEEAAGRAIAEARALSAEHRRVAESSTETIHTLTTERSAREGRRNTLEDLEQSFAGAFAGVKAILSAREEGHGAAREVAGMVADLIQVPQDVAVAVETILGSGAQDIVVETAQGAQRCIEYLKERRAGRATFLPLDRIRPRSALDRRLSGLRGVVGEAIDLVEFDERFRRVMEYLLCGVLVVDNLTVARELAAGEARGVRLVTLEGEVINPHGAMTGGKGNDNRAGMITRKAEKDALTGEIARLEERILAAVESRNVAVACAEDAAARVETCEKEYRTLQTRCQEVERTLSLREAERERIGRDLERIRVEQARIEEAIHALAETGSPVEGGREALLRREAEIEAWLPQRLETQRATREELDAVVEAMAAVREQRVEAQARVEELGRRIATICRDRHERTCDLEECESFLGRAGGEAEALVTRIGNLKEREVESLAERERMQGAGSGIRDELHGVRDALEEKRNTERAIQRRLNEIQQALGTLQMKENETNLKLDAVIEKAREELQIEDLPERAARVAAAEAAEAADAANAEGRHTPVGDGTDGEAGGADASGDGEAVTGSAGSGAPDVFDPESLTRDEFHQRITAPDARLPEYDDEALRTLVAGTASRIEKIGPVNMCAIEELAELEARGEFLKAEQEDIQGAVDDLMRVVDRLNTECSRRFEETFNAVRENFQEMFRKLFNGGKADLILEDPGPDGDALDAGIEIIARPPGKEPKSISLLSGGEKALSAVALLFAIFRSKPSPFCILDEVDGPLDESNIDRFMGTVREFTDETQFIMISHSKRTMGMVDQIYGVTQQEPGVSTKFSMRFNDSFNRAGAREPVEADADAVAAG